MIAGHLQHLPAGFTVVDHSLRFGGRTMEELAEMAGRTPFYVYSREAIDGRIAALRQALPGEVKIRYAMKANPLPALVSAILPGVDGLDVASAGELEVALAAGADPAVVSFAGPGKTDAELAAAVRAGITVNLESAGEMRRLAHIGAESGQRPRAALRINPAYELKQSGMHMGGGAKPFGIDEEQIPAVLRELHELPIDFTGFHVFAGSQVLNPDTLIESLRAAVEVVTRLGAPYADKIRYVNLGGGFGVPYFPGEKPFDLNMVGKALGEFVGPAQQVLPQASFAVELGRYLVAEAGIYATRIVDRKVSRGKTFLIADGGLHHHLALSGNFGQVIRKNYPVGIANKIDLPAEENVDVAGCLCTPLDRLGDDVALPKPEVGDLFVVFQSGAYGASASPTAFLGHQPPVELFV